MRLSNETNTLGAFLETFKRCNNINISLVRFGDSFELSFIDLDNMEYYLNYELVLKNGDIEKYGFKEIQREIDISNFEIKVLSPIDYLAKDEIYEYWSLEYELQEFIDNRFFG